MLLFRKTFVLAASLIASLVFSSFVVWASEVTVYDSKAAFTTEHNNGPYWFWQYYNVETGKYENMTMTNSAGTRWILPNPFHPDVNVAKDEGVLYAAVEAERMYPENLQNLSSAKTRYAVKTFVSPDNALAIITNNGRFGGDQSGRRRAKIMLNDTRIWPTDAEWSVTDGWANFDFPANGITVEVSKGDRLHFVIANAVEGTENTYRYNSQAIWAPVVTLKKPFVVQAYSFKGDDQSWNAVQGNWDATEDSYVPSNADDFSLSLLGDNEWKNYTANVKVQPHQINGAVYVYTYYQSLEENYNIEFSSNMTSLRRGSRPLAMSDYVIKSNQINDVVVETKSVSDGVLITVSVDGENIFHYTDKENPMVTGGAFGLGTAYSTAEFKNMSVTVNLYDENEHNNNISAQEAVRNLEENPSIENLKNTAEKIALLNNTLLRQVLQRRFDAVVSNFNDIIVNTYSATRTVEIKGLLYGDRGRTIELVITGPNQFSKTVSAVVDDNGDFSCSCVFDESVPTGEYTLTYVDRNIVKKFNYRKPSSQNEIISFRVEGVNATISGNTVYVQLKERAEIKKLIPIFTLSEYAEAYVNGVRQISGQSMVDFSNDVYYVVRAENGEEATYIVKVVPYQPSSSGGGGGGRKGTVIRSGSFSIANPVPVDDNSQTISDAKEYFSDLESVPWAKEYVNYCYEKGIISGTGDGRFEPQRYVTRSEFIKMIVIAFNIPKGESEITFLDVTPGDWQYPFVQAAVNAKIALGIGGGYFGLNDYISREDMCVMLYRVAQAKLIDKDYDVRFEDEKDISSYAIDSVTALAKGGFIHGIEGRFLPKDNATRAEAVKLIASICMR